MQNPNAITLFVDADACPVKDEILRISARHRLKTYLVSNSWLRLEVGDTVEKIVVGAGADAADDWIAVRADQHAIVITADIPLAKRVLDAGGVALGPSGRAFTDHGIAMAIALRDLKQHLRETGESKGYNPSFTKGDRACFKEALELAIQKMKRRA